MLDAGLKHHLDAIDLGAKLDANNPGANDTGAEVAAMSPSCLRRPKTLTPITTVPT